MGVGTGYTLLEGHTILFDVDLVYLVFDEYLGLSTSTSVL